MQLVIEYSIKINKWQPDCKNIFTERLSFSPENVMFTVVSSSIQLNRFSLSQKRNYGKICKIKHLSWSIGQGLVSAMSMYSRGIFTSLEEGGGSGAQDCWLYMLIGIGCFVVPDVVVVLVVVVQVFLPCFWLVSLWETPLCVSIVL